MWCIFNIYNSCVHPTQFRYYLGDGYDNLTATSRTFNFTSPPGSDSTAQPQSIHIAPTGASGQLFVQWISASKTPAPAVYVWKGSSSTDERPDFVFHAANSTTYLASDLCNAPATTESWAHWKHPGFTHTAVATGLTPGAQYAYAVGQPKSPAVTSASGRGDGASAQQWQGMSEIFRFHAPGAAPKTAEPASAVAVRPASGESALRDGGRSDFTYLIVYADMGVAAFPAAGGTALRVTAEIDLAQSTGGLGWPMPEAVWHVGDISYAWGQVKVWDQFQALIEPIAARVPYLVTVG